MEPYTWIVESKRLLTIGLTTGVCLVLVASLTWLTPPECWFELEFPSLTTADPERWTSHQRDRFVLGLGIDFAFLMFYPAFLSLLLSHFSPPKNDGCSRGRISRSASIWVWAACPLDALENVGMFLWVRGAADPVTNLITSCAAGAKWLIVVAAAGVLATAAARWQFNRLKAQSRHDSVDGL